MYFNASQCQLRESQTTRSNAIQMSGFWIANLIHRIGICVVTFISLWSWAKNNSMKYLDYLAELDPNHLRNGPCVVLSYVEIDIFVESDNDLFKQHLILHRHQILKKIVGAETSLHPYLNYKSHSHRNSAAVYSHANSNRVIWPCTVARHENTHRTAWLPSDSTSSLGNQFMSTAFCKISPVNETKARFVWLKATLGRHIKIATISIP